MIMKENSTVVFSGSHCMAVLNEGDRPLVGDKTKTVTDINRYKPVVEAEMADGTVVKRDILEDHLDKSNKREVEFHLDEGVAAGRIYKGYMTEELVPWYVAVQFAGKEPVVFLEFHADVKGDPKMEVYEKNGYYFIYTTPQGPDLAYEKKENVREEILKVAGNDFEESNFTLKKDDLGLFDDKEHTGEILSHAL
jgi:hypothetical protein